jgi:hypothetical protein
MRSDQPVQIDPFAEYRGQALRAAMGCAARCAGRRVAGFVRQEVQLKHGLALRPGPIIHRVEVVKLGGRAHLDR